MKKLSEANTKIIILSELNEKKMIKKKNTFNFSLNPHVSIRSFSCFRDIKNTFNFSLNIFFIKYQDLKEKK